jgi:hypothetical protein
MSATVATTPQRLDRNGHRDGEDSELVADCIASSANRSPPPTAPTRTPAEADFGR